MKNEKNTDGEKIENAIVAALREILQRDPGPIGKDENIFSKFDLDSMATINVLSKLEKRFDIVIGEDIADFDLIKTLSGFKQLIGEKTTKAQVISDFVSE